MASLGFGHAERVVAGAEAAGVQRAVFFSSTSIYTRLPAASKPVRLAAEDRVRRMRGGGWTLLRPTMIYGDAGDRNLSRLVRFVARSPLVPLPGGGHALVQPVHVDDLARAAVDALECPQAVARTYELPGADAVSLRELVLLVAQLLGRRVRLLPLPLVPMAALAGLWHATRLPPRVSREQVLRLAEDKAFGYADARRDFGYAPRSLAEGLAREVDALRAGGLV